MESGMDLRYSHKKQKPFERRAFCRPGTPQSSAQYYTITAMQPKSFNHVFRLILFLVVYFGNRIAHNVNELLK